MDGDDARLADGRERALALEREVAKVVIGQARVIRLVTTAVFARGHVLLQGDVGVGKTTVAARACAGARRRVRAHRGHVDLMPADLVYYTYIDADGRPRSSPGR